MKITVVPGVNHPTRGMFVKVTRNGVTTNRRVFASAYHALKRVGVAVISDKPMKDAVKMRVRIRETGYMSSTQYGPTEVSFGGGRVCTMGLKQLGFDVNKVKNVWIKKG